MRNSISYFMVVCLTIVLYISAANAFGQAAQSTSAEARGSKNDETNTYVTGLTSGRARSLVGGVLALSSLIIAWRVRCRSTSASRKRRTWTITALLLGILAVLLSVVHLTNNTGGFGTGGGKAGAIVASVLGLAGIVISGLALRSEPEAS